MKRLFHLYTGLLVVGVTGGVLLSQALANHGAHASNTHTKDGVYHGIYTEHKASGSSGWYFHAWTQHGHGGEKYAAITHTSGSPHFHCSAGPYDQAGRRKHTHCSAHKLNSNHHSLHDAKIDPSPSNCKKYSDGHGICFHIHNGPNE